MREHDEVIRAWLDGKEIEFRSSNERPWKPFDARVFTNPMTYTELEWRIYPEAKTITIPIFSNASNVAAYFNKETREIVIEYEEEVL